MDFEPGTQFADRYRIIKIIGRGGVGTVLKAEDARFGRIVALKIFNQAAINKPEFARQVLREADVLRQLNHPSIIRLYDFGVYQDVPYLVMEYAERSLADVLREGKQRPEYAIGIITQVADALSYAHSKGIVHRDIKPSNILLASDNRILLSDFGLALPSGVSSLTDEGLVFGTPTYVSPEQAKGLPLDARSDIYSLAVVLFELLVGRPPFLGSSPTEIVAQHVEKPVPLELLRPLNAPQLENVLAKALAKEPGDRHATVEEFARDLREILKWGMLYDVQHARPSITRLTRGLVALVIGLLVTSVVIVALVRVNFQDTQVLQLPSPTQETPFPTQEMPFPIPEVVYHKATSWPWMFGVVLILGVAGGLGLLLIVKGRFRRHLKTSGFPLNRSQPSILLSVPVPTAEVQPEELTSRHKSQLPEASLARNESPVSHSCDEATQHFHVHPFSTVSSSRTLQQRRPGLVLAWLVPINGPNAGQTFQLSDNEFTIGRDAAYCNLSLNDRAVSRIHARIRFEEGQFYVYDEGSANGTYVNGEMVSRHQLRDRDEIVIGQTNFIFKEVATLSDLTTDAQRRLREFEALWSEVGRAASYD